MSAIARWPRTLLPALSSGGEITAIPNLPGDTAMRPPPTPLFAGQAGPEQPLAGVVVEPGRRHHGEDAGHVLRVDHVLAR